MKDYLNLVVFQNSVKDYLIFLVIFVGLFLLFRFFRLVVIDRIKVFSEKTENDFDDFVIEAIEGISKFFYWFVAFYFASKFIFISEKFHLYLGKIFLLSITYELIVILNKFIDYWVHKFSERKDKSSKAAFLALGRGAKWISWLLAFLFILSSFGVNITALITGLGIGGVAIAFALQGVLKDLFSYFTILLDKPVRIGDYIDVNGKKGTVKDIGLKTTRLEAVDGQEIVVANDILTSSVVDNYGKAKKRRVQVQYGIGYDTDVKTIKKLKKEIIKIIDKKDEVELSRCHLRNLSDSSMDFDIVYYISNREYNLYMDINEDINLKILELFEKNGVEIPYPTRTVYNRKG